MRPSLSRVPRGVAPLASDAEQRRREAARQVLFLLHGTAISCGAGGVGNHGQGAGIDQDARAGLRLDLGQRSREVQNLFRDDVGFAAPLIVTGLFKGCGFRHLVLLGQARQPVQAAALRGPTADLPQDQVRPDVPGTVDIAVVALSVLHGTEEVDLAIGQPSGLVGARCDQARGNAGRKALVRRRGLRLFLTSAIRSASSSGESLLPRPSSSDDSVIVGLAMVARDGVAATTGAANSPARSERRAVVIVGELAMIRCLLEVPGCG